MTLHSKSWSCYCLPRFVSVFGFGSVFDHRLRRSCSYHKIKKYACVCVCMSVFKSNNLFSKSWSSSVSIKRLGHPMDWAKRLRLSNTTHHLKHKARTETSILRSSFLKDCDEKITEDRNPWGKPKRTHKNKNMQRLPQLPQILSIVSLDNIGVHGWR